MEKNKTREIMQELICANLFAVIMVNNKHEEYIDHYKCKVYGAAFCQLHCSDGLWVDFEECIYRI